MLQACVQGRPVCGYFLLFIFLSLKIITKVYRPTKIDSTVRTSLQNRRGNMANVTSAIDTSIDNNDKDKKQRETSFFVR